MKSYIGIPLYSATNNHIMTIHCIDSYSHAITYNLSYNKQSTVRTSSILDIMNWLSNHNYKPNELEKDFDLGELN